jgi:hypothetical protein
MSTISQRLALFFTANAGQAQASIGQLGNSFLRMGNAAGRSAQGTSLVNQQMRALGTTFRYMLAGGAIYGALNATRQLAQFQQQIGLIAAIGGSSGMLNTSRQIGDLKNQMYGASVELIQPLGDVADAITNYLSTVQGRPRSEIIPSVEAIGKAAKLSQTPIEDMTKALTTMNVAFGRPVSTRNIEDFAAKWYELISLAPGGVSAAPQLVGQMGNIAVGARMAALRPGQMMALTLGTLRFGIPPQQAGQGLAYLLRSLATPEAPGTIKSAREMFSSLGISNEFIRHEGGMRALIKIFRAARDRGVHGDFGRAAQIARAGGDQVDPNQISDLPIGGQGINVLATIFRRQHALRTAIALYSMWQSGQLGRDLEKLGDSTQAFMKQQAIFAEAWRKFSEQSGLAKAGRALESMRMQFMEGIDPAIELLAKPLPWLQKTLQHHEGITKALGYGTIGLLGALGINKLTGGMLGRTVLGRLPIIGGLLGAGTHAALLAKTAEDFSKNAVARNIQDGSPERPFYVIVMGELDPRIQKGTPGVPGSPLPPVVAGGRFAGLSRARLFGYAGLAVGGAFAGYELYKAWGSKAPPRMDDGGVPTGRFVGPHAHRGVMNLGHGFYYSPQHGILMQDSTGKLAPIPKLSQQQAGAFTASQLGITMKQLKQIENLTKRHDIASILDSGNKKLLAQIADISTSGMTIDLTIVQDGKKTTKRVHLPMDTVFKGGKSPGALGRKKVIKKTVHQ